MKRFSGYLQASAGANMYGYGGESARSIFRARTGNLSIYNTLAYVRQRYFSDNESEYLFKETGSDILSREEYRSWGGYLSDRLNLSYEINPSHSLGVSGYSSPPYSPSTPVPSRTSATRPDSGPR